MDLESLFSTTPYNELLGIDVIEVGEGHATGRLPFSEDLRSHSEGEVIHGGATYSLADTTAGAAVISLAGAVTPTVDMRIDYLAPATSSLTAEAEVIRHGQSLAMTRVEITDSEGTHVATAHGTYKITGQGEETPWSDQPTIVEGRDE